MVGERQAELAGFIGSSIEPDVSTSSIRLGVLPRAAIVFSTEGTEMAAGVTGSKSYV